MQIKRRNHTKEQRKKTLSTKRKIQLTPCVEKFEFEFDVSDSESEESFPGRIRKRSKRLNVIVAETDPSEDGIESIDLSNKSENEDSIIGPRRSSRKSPGKLQTFLSSDESEYFDALEVMEKSATDKESSQRVSNSNLGTGHDYST